MEIEVDGSETGMEGKPLVERGEIINKKEYVHARAFAPAGTHAYVG
jgi:hypothetical protein